MKEKERERPSQFLVFEGDWGGQIYLTAPVEKILCSPEVLQQLLRDIDRICWSCNDGQGASLYVIRSRPGAGVSGGMGGGATLDGLWLHDRLHLLRPRIEAVLDGSSSRIARDDEVDDLRIDVRARALGLTPQEFRQRMEGGDRR